MANDTAESSDKEPEQQGYGCKAKTVSADCGRFEYSGPALLKYSSLPNNTGKDERRF